MPQSFHLDRLKSAELSPQQEHLYQVPEKGHMVPFFVLNFSGTIAKHCILEQNSKFNKIQNNDQMVTHYVATKGQIFNFTNADNKILGTYTIGDQASVITL